MIGGVDAEVASYIDGCTAADLKEKCIQLGLLSSIVRLQRTKRRHVYVTLINTHIQQRAAQRENEDNWAQCDSCNKWRLVSWQFNPTQEVSGLIYCPCLFVNKINILTATQTTKTNPNPNPNPKKHTTK